jgi:hypothetical protein
MKISPSLPPPPLFTAPLPTPPPPHIHALHGRVTGCSAQSIPALYNGSTLIAAAPATSPVVVVTVNYRLGVLANIYLEAAATNASWPTSGNYNYVREHRAVPCCAAVGGGWGWGGGQWAAVFTFFDTHLPPSLCAGNADPFVYRCTALLPHPPTHPSPPHPPTHPHSSHAA